MNREIKFRIWDTVLKCWCETSKYLIQADGTTIYFNNGGYDDLYNQTSKLILQRYTGLKDKNGKEIYEGDILTETIEVYRIGKVTYNCQVVYKNSAFGLIFTKEFDIGKPKEEWTPFYSGIEEDKEVIGNEFENPELISDSN